MPLVMQQESCASRASSIGGDWFHLGRVRSLDEVTSIINSFVLQVEASATELIEVVTLRLTLQRDDS